jgi:hypothetical protein
MDNHRHGVAGPLILIAIGAAFLLTNMGLISWSAWGLFRLWPLILVAIGIDLLIGRRSALGSVVAAILIAAVLGGGLWLASTGYQPPTGTATRSVEQPLQNATQAEVNLRPAVGALRLDSLPASSPNLVSGNILGAQTNEARTDFSVSGGKAKFQMETAGTAVFVPTVGAGPTWDLQISSSVPMQLRIEQGVGDMSVDLTQVQLTDLTVNLGIGQMTVRLPAKGQYQADIGGAIGDTSVILPPGLEARITLNAALAGRSVPDGFTRQGNQYVSSGYTSAANRVDLVLGQAIGNVTVRRTAP